MRYLIDGYNLLYAMGLVRGRAGPTGLEKARGRLLGLLGWSGADQPGEVTVVFDAAGAPPGATAEEVHRNVRVRFAVQHAQADDLIEELIQHDSAPKNLTVVSDDHRVQQAARRRHCTVLKCGDYLDWLERRRRAKRMPPDQPDKPEHLSERETQRWLDEFGL